MMMAPPGIDDKPTEFEIFIHYYDQSKTSKTERTMQNTSIFLYNKLLRSDPFQISDIIINVQFGDVAIFNLSQFCRWGMVQYPTLDAFRRMERVARYSYGWMLPDPQQHGCNILKSIKRYPASSLYTTLQYAVVVDTLTKKRVYHHRGILSLDTVEDDVSDIEGILSIKIVHDVEFLDFDMLYPVWIYVNYDTPGMTKDIHRNAIEGRKKRIEEISSKIVIKGCNI